MKHNTLLTVLLATLLILAIMPAAAQEETGVARVRIGYFAFDPRENDTYMNSEPVSFSFKSGWAEVLWEAGLPGLRTETTTPYIDVPGGFHSFAFVEGGGSLDAAFLGPITVEFKPGHMYSLALVGQKERNNVNLLMVDETEAFAGIDPEANYRGLWVHNIAGAPPLQFTVDGDVLVDNLHYGQIATLTYPVGLHLTAISTVGDEPTVLFTSGDTEEPRYCELVALSGTYPGEVGSDIFEDWNWAYPGELTVVDQGTVAIGDTLDGEVPAIMQRVAYTLHLNNDTSLDISVHGTSLRTADSIFYPDYFDPMFYVYDSTGSLLFWNDEQSTQDGAASAALEGVTLKAGDYTIEVGGFTDLIAGPYRLVVERAE